MEFQPYPFEKLNVLIKDIPTKEGRISLTIGEPQFQTPDFISKALCQNVSLLNKYPKTAGEVELGEALRGFVQRRFGVSLREDEMVSTFGTREVLFNFPQFYLFDKESPTMSYPNPFYQIYEGAAIASRARVIHMNLTKENNFNPGTGNKPHWCKNRLM